MTAARGDQQRVFMLTLIGKPGNDPTPGIRHILKLALRRYGLRCVHAREIAPPSEAVDSGGKALKPVAPAVQIKSD